MWEFITANTDADTTRWAAADIGPGGGFPGLVWKLAAPELRVALIERKSRRAFFLDRVVHRLGLSDTVVLEVDVRELVRRPEHREAYDVAAMIAVTTPQEIGGVVESLLKPGGYFACSRVSAAAPWLRVGSCLDLAARTATPEGTFLLYQKR
jgi:16S rRNA (guanine527-N7)-methyltransferase